LATVSLQCNKSISINQKRSQRAAVDEAHFTRAFWACHTATHYTRQHAATCCNTLRSKEELTSRTRQLRHFELVIAFEPKISTRFLCTSEHQKARSFSTKSKIPCSLKLIVLIKQKTGTRVKTPPPEDSGAGKNATHCNTLQHTATHSQTNYDSSAP